MIDIPLLRRKNGLDRGLVVGSIAIGGSWLYLNRAALYWLATSIVDLSLFNGAILVAGALLLALLGWHYRQSIELAPGLYRLPLLLIFGCSVTTISTQWLVSLAQLPVGLFLLASTWLEGRQIGLRWIVVGLANLVFLAIANTARVLILTILTHVLHQSAWAEILHVPLGLIGFVVASLLTWGLLRWVPKASSQSKTDDRAETTLMSLNWQSLLGVSGLVLALAIIPVPQTDPAIAAVDLSRLQWAEPMQTQPWDLNPSEQKFFANYPGVTTRKQQFQYGDLTGTSVLVASPTWQAHHSPEVCLASIGYKIAPEIQQLVTPDVTARWLSLDDGKKFAVYWFQSATSTTDNFSSRFWDEVFRRDFGWTLVSVVFDRSNLPESPAVKAFIKQTHDAIDRLQPEGKS